MPCSAFKLGPLIKKYKLTETRKMLFPSATSLPISDWLKQTLSFVEVVPLLSEKVRSEIIVMPILLEMLRKNENAFSIYSGITLDIDDKLKGECDFILSKQPNTHTIQSPIFALIEAKNNDINVGIPQCLAQMLAARFFNEREGNAIKDIYGCVTTAETWQFLKLSGNTFIIDNQRYYFNDVPNILGVLQYIIDSY